MLITPVMPCPCPSLEQGRPVKLLADQLLAHDLDAAAALFLLIDRLSSASRQISNTTAKLDPPAGWWIQDSIDTIRRDLIGRSAATT